MIKPENLKQTLDNSSAMIQEAMKTTTSKTEEIAALNAVQILHPDWLETLAKKTTHPDFDENFRLIGEKIAGVVNLM
ncbi:MAG: hypothetical protein K9H16_04735 [Bacteroidales bacterium]|nr:hypothetical protein [Bacteroidales bacterium]